MNIKEFIELRKKRGFSQSDLCENICTQATLSRFENGGKIPSLKIIIQLCEKLGMPLNDLFPKVELSQSEVDEKLDEVEFYLITSEYDQAEVILDKISKDTIKITNLESRILYLKGYCQLYTDTSTMDTLFTFDQLLLVEDKEEIYTLLAYNGLGMFYAKNNNFEKATLYFDKVFERVFNYRIKTTEDTWRILNIVYHCGEFYSCRKEWEISDELMKYAIGICSDNHVTYYLARASTILAENAIYKKEETPLILELLQDSIAYAKINRNQKLLEKLKILQSKYT